MIIKVVCAGKNDFYDLYVQDEQEMFVGVDGGIKNIIDFGKKVDLAVGDFDSCAIEEVVMHCEKIRVFPKEKDLGDLELALLEIADIEHEKIIIYNTTGDRIDHYHAALNLIIRHSHLNIEIVDKQNRIRIIDKTTEIEKGKYKYVSFFAVDDGVKISLSGFKYQLNNYSLSRFDNLGLSNELKEDAGTVEINNKRVIVIESN